MNEYETSPESKYRSIKEWSIDDKPREKLKFKGPSSLSDSELIAILLRVGTSQRSAIDVSRDLLDKYENKLGELTTRSLSELSSIKGIGEAKAIGLMAAFEIARRVKPSVFMSKLRISSPEDVADIYIPRLKDEKVESFRILILNSAHIVKREHIVSTGTLNSSLVHPREVFREAIVESAASIMLMHNHPSGNPNPSEADIRITKQLKSAGKLLDIDVIDHIIIAGDTFTSLRTLGHL
ncbi:MAG: DNA repair protein RadC [Candidatus Kapaibacteriales bacterium]